MLNYRALNSSVVHFKERKTWSHPRAVSRESTMGYKCNL